MFYKRQQGQTFIEYSLMLGILVSVLIVMTPMMRRGIQGMVKVVADQVGTQQNAEQQGGRFGQLINSTTLTRTLQDIESRDWMGIKSKAYIKDQAFTQSSVYMNQGFTEKE